MERIYSFEQVVYEFCKENEPYCFFTLEQLKSGDSLQHPEYKASEEEADPQSKFRNLYNEMQKDFKDILRIFGVEFYREDFKVRSSYMFDAEGKDFLIELITRYRKKTIWVKEIKKLNTYEEQKNNFATMYRSSRDQDEFFQEIQFTVEGLMGLYFRLDEVKEEKKQEFKNILHVSTQYQLLCWQNEMKEQILSVPELFQEDVEQSVAGVLLQDYREWLYHVRDGVKEYLATETARWQSIVSKRKEEYKEVEDDEDEEVGEFIGRIQEKIKKHVEEMHRTNSSNPSVKRRENSDVAQIIRKIIDETVKENPEVASRALERFIPEE